MNKKWNTGKQAWNHGTVIRRHANGNVEREVLGPCPRCGTSTVNYGMAYSCQNLHCNNSASRFVRSPDPIPEWWRNDVQVTLDGDSWCAYRGDSFVNLQESCAGFGDSPQAAVDSLEEDEER